MTVIIPPRVSGAGQGVAGSAATLDPHVCELCPPSFRPIAHHCVACADQTPDWRGTICDHRALDSRFSDHRLAIHRRRVGIERDPETGFPLLHVCPPGTRAFIDPGFEVLDVPWVRSPYYVGRGRPDPAFEETGCDIWGACAITGLSLSEVYNRQGALRVDDGGMHELFLECRRPDGRYSPISLWEFRIDILESREAEKTRRKQRKDLAAFLAKREADGHPINPHGYGTGRERGAPEEDPYYPLDGRDYLLGR